MGNRTIAIIAWSSFLFIDASLLTVGPSNLIYEAKTGKTDALPPSGMLACLLVALVTALVGLVLGVFQKLPGTRKSP